MEDGLPTVHLLRKILERLTELAVLIIIFLGVLMIGYFFVSPLSVLVMGTMLISIGVFEIWKIKAIRDEKENFTAVPTIHYGLISRFVGSMIIFSIFITLLLILTGLVFSILVEGTSLSEGQNSLGKWIIFFPALIFSKALKGFLLKNAVIDPPITTDAVRNSLLENPTQENVLFHLQHDLNAFFLHQLL